MYAIFSAALITACGQTTPTADTAVIPTEAVVAPVATEALAATGASTTTPTTVVTPTQTPKSAQAPAGAYEPVSAEVCQIIQEDATKALTTTFTFVASAPFTDTVKGEAGQGCNLTAKGTGVDFGNPSDVMAKLVSAFIGWTEQVTYQADGPTGSATAMTRDMGLMLIRAEWSPAPEVSCPADQPISACGIKPEQQIYTIEIQVAQK